MPQGPMSSPLMRPFVVLALPGMYLFYKYSQYKRRRRESARRRLTERELQHLNHKIDKLLSKLEENEPELATTQEEERRPKFSIVPALNGPTKQCVICINAKATMQTSPCGHQVVCRKCFVKTIQMAVSQRLLPLRCVICRAKILRLKQTGSPPGTSGSSGGSTSGSSGSSSTGSGSSRSSSGMPTSVSGYSVASSSGTSVPASDSLYSVSSGGSSLSSETGLGCTGNGCCQGRTCLGAYPRQPTGALRRSQQHAMKMKLQDYYAEKSSVCRLPPIREMSPHAVPRAVSAPGSTRIRCAQKIVTQLETAPVKSNSKNYFRSSSGYEKLPQIDPHPPREKVRWSDRSLNKDRDRDKHKSDELVDNKKNELAEKKLAETEKQNEKKLKELEKQAKKELKEEKKKLKKEAKEKKT